MTNVGISRCLGFDNCRYDAGIFSIKLNEAKQFLNQKGIINPNFITVCPEQAGGLPTPRIPSEIKGGTGQDVWEGKAKVVNKKGEDVTKQFKLGAINTLKTAIDKNIDIFILKEKSPSCGSDVIYNGKFNGNKIAGEGVTSALLKMCGIKVFPETQVFSEVKNIKPQKVDLNV